MGPYKYHFGGIFQCVFWIVYKLIQIIVRFHVKQFQNV